MREHRECLAACWSWLGQAFGRSLHSVRIKHIKYTDIRDPVWELGCRKEFGGGGNGEKRELRGQCAHLQAILSSQ